MKAAYGFEPTTAWLDHVRLSAVRIAGSCSASVVSPNGLVMTNHAKARFEVFGTSTYPDATFTLRLSFGALKGYTQADGKIVGPRTTFGGAFAHATGAAPFALRPSHRQ